MQRPPVRAVLPGQAMIDNPYQVDALLLRLARLVPFHAEPSAGLASLLRRQRPEFDLAQGLRVTLVSYAGDVGGIMCRAEAAGGAGGSAVHASLTHLRLDPRHPLAFDVASYQRRRAKRIRPGARSFAAAAGAYR